MAIPSQKFREIVFQMLYSYDMGKPDPEHAVSMLMNELAVTRKCVLEAQAVVNKILAQTDVIDAKITEASEKYNFDRIHSVERNILRLGIYEMLFDDNIPPKVAISESMRLAKKFSTAEARSFINAIMDRIYKGMETNE